MQANFVGAKPRRMTYSWKDAMVAASLHRVIFHSDYRPWPGALDRRNTFSTPLGDHELGWGRQLFCYGFDEYFLKEVSYWQHTTDGTGLFSPIPSGSYDPGELGTASFKDATFLRCRSAWLLDVMWLCTHDGANSMAMVSRDSKKMRVIDADAEENLRSSARQCGLSQ